jgi:hypothetical protein
MKIIGTKDKEWRVLSCDDNKLFFNDYAILR